MYTFLKSQKLLKPAEFKRVFAEQNLKSIDDCLTVLAANNSVGYSRLGLALSKKQLKRAVDRNRVKRVIRESFRLNQAQLPPVDIVILARSGLQSSEKSKLHDRLARHWARLERGWQKQQH